MFLFLPFNTVLFTLLHCSLLTLLASLLPMDVDIWTYLHSSASRIFFRSRASEGHILWLREVNHSSPCFIYKPELCLGRPCLSSSDRFLFCWAAFFSFDQPPASVFSVSLPLFFLFLWPCLTGWDFFAWIHFLAFMECANDSGSRPATYSYSPVQSYSCSLCVFYRTLVASWKGHLLNST